LWCISLGPSFIYFEAPTYEFLGIQSFYGSQTFFPIRHFHKSESPGASCKTVRDDFRGLNVTVALKEFPELVLARVEGQVANIDVDTGHSQAPFQKAFLWRAQEWFIGA
jgi:hypothetical protein